MKYQQSQFQIQHFSQKERSIFSEQDLKHLKELNEDLQHQNDDLLQQFCKSQSESQEYSKMTKSIEKKFQEAQQSIQILLKEISFF
jgi:hypothetical protein